MYATVFTVVMVLQFNLLTVFHCSVFGMFLQFVALDVERVVSNLN